MRECGSGASCIGLISKVHGRDKATAHGEYVEDLAVPKNTSPKVPDDLVHPDADPASVFLDDGQGFDTAIELAPLSGPIGADFFFSNNFAALRSLRSVYVLGHQRQRTFAFQIFQIAVSYLRPGGGQRQGARFAACKAEHLMARPDQLRDDPGTDETFGSCDKVLHRNFSELLTAELTNGCSPDSIGDSLRVKADVRGFPFQTIVATCPLSGEQRRYMPSEVISGLPHHPVTKEARAGMEIPS
jgi:hypothetical protein